MEMMSSGGHSPESSEPTSQEVERVSSMGGLTIFFLRHAETPKDKTENRTLTEQGEQQVADATREIVRRLLLDANNGQETTDDQRGEILSRISFNLYDSGSDRTIRQGQIQKETLISLGIPEENIYFASEQSGLGVASRIKEMGGLSKFRQFVQKGDDPLVRWATIPDEELKANEIETASEVGVRVKEELGNLDRIGPRIVRHIDPQREVVCLVNSHAAPITVAAAQEFGQEITELGTAENAGGFSLSYSQDGQRTVAPFGTGYESKVHPIATEIESES